MPSPIRAHSLNCCSAQYSSLSTLTRTDAVIFSVLLAIRYVMYCTKTAQPSAGRRGQTSAFKYCIFVMFCYLPRFCPSPRLSSHHFLSVAVRTKCTAVIAVNSSPGIPQNVKFAHLSCSGWFARPSRGFRHSRSIMLVALECRRLIHTNSIPTI